MKRFILSLVLFAVFIGSFAAADFLDATFWASSPTDNQIETALFATDSSYTENWTGYSSACSISGVIYLSEGTDVLPNTGASNTIYVLDAGTYTTSYQVNLSDCSAIVGNGDVTLQSSGQLTRQLFGSGNQNIIIDNITIHGDALHVGSGDSYAVEFLGGSKNISMHKLINTKTQHGIVIRSSNNILLDNVESYLNTERGTYFHTVSYMRIKNSKFYENLGTSYGYYNDDAGLYFYNCNHIDIDNIKSYNNARNGIITHWTNYLTISNSLFFSNLVNGISFSYSNHIFCENISSYNNNDIGINFYKTYLSTINNGNIFNNRRGIILGTYTSHQISRNSFNNINIFNNDYGIYARGDTNDILNNINIFNNLYGIYSEDDTHDNYFNQVNIYNNLVGINFDYYWNITKNLPSYGNKYYGTLQMFNNSNNFSGLALSNGVFRAGYETLITETSISSGFIISGTNHDGTALFIAATGGMESLNWIPGIFDNTQSFDENTMLIEPINSSGVSLFNGMSTDKRGQNMDWIADDNINLIYGKDISKQIQPIYNNDNTYTFSNFPWNYSVYIGKSWDPDFYFIDKHYLTGVSATSSFNTDDTTFIGEEDLDVGLFSSGTFNKNVVLQSTGTNKIETFINSGVFFKQNDGTTNYDGLLRAPLELDKDTASELKGHWLPSVIKVGADNQTIRFKNSGGNNTTVIVRIPVPGMTIGTPLEIFYSADGNSWNTLTSTNVIDINGDPYAEFETTHFTYFAVSGGTGSFVINNDDTSVSFSGVTLSLDASGAQYMRFSNDGSNRSTWESYVTSKEWFLEDIPGTKTVYVEFDLNGDFTGDISTFDTIYLLDVQQGQLTLEILTGESECVYGTSLNLSGQDVKLNEGYTFTGSFSGQWYCADYVGVSGGWVLDISVSDLTNEGGNIISGGLITIGHDGAVTEGDSSCTGYSGAPSTFNTDPYELIEKTSGSDKICKVTLNNVHIEVAVPAFQAPGNYNGTLTLTIPSF